MPLPKRKTNSSASKNVMNVNGERAGDMDPIMLQLIWSQQVREEAGRNARVITASVGHPTLNITIYACLAAKEYWEQRFAILKKQLENLCALDKLKQVSLRKQIEMVNQAMTENLREIPALAKRLIAEGANRFYHIDDMENVQFKVQAEHMVLSTGGAGGLRAVFDFLKHTMPSARIATPAPHYPLYASLDKALLTIDVLEKPGYRFTGKVLREALMKAKDQGQQISALLLCNPNNPLGLIIRRDEWPDIVDVIAKEKFYLIFDEAYIEMPFCKNIPLLEFILLELNTLEMAWQEKRRHHGVSDDAEWLSYEAKKKMCQDILSRIILMRSGTKAFSAAGERMATLGVFSGEARSYIQERIDYLAAPPYSTRIAYAKAMSQLFQPQHWQELCLYRQYYYTQVQYVANEIRKMGLNLPSEYTVQGTFYLVVNFDFLMGRSVPPGPVLEQLHRAGLALNDRINTDVEIGFYLLFKHHISITPLSYFAADPKKGYMRITCSAGRNTLSALLQKVDAELRKINAEKKSEKEASKAAVTKTPLKPGSAFKALANDLSTRVLIMAEHDPASNARFERVVTPSPERKKSDELALVDIKKKNEVVQLESDVLTRDQYQKKFNHDMFHACARFFHQEVIAYWQTAYNRALEVHMLCRKYLDEIYMQCLARLKFAIMAVSQGILMFDDALPGNIFVTSRELETLREEIMGRIETMNCRIPRYRGFDLKKNASEMIFQKIEYDVFSGKQSIATEVFRKIYERTLQAMLADFSLIEAVVAAHASIDYSHPAGDERNRSMAAGFINYFLPGSDITKQDVLFFGGNPVNLLGNLLNLIPLNKIKNLEERMDFPPALVLSINDCESLTEERVVELAREAKLRKMYVVFEDCLIDSSEEGAMQARLQKFILLLPKDRVILLQSSIMFAGQNERSSIIVTRCPALQAKVLEESICCHGQAACSLQSGFAKTLQHLVELSKDCNASPVPSPIVLYSSRPTSRSTSRSGTPLLSACNSPILDSSSSSNVSTPRSQSPNPGPAFNTDSKARSLPVSPAKPHKKPTRFSGEFSAHDVLSKPVVYKPSARRTLFSAPFNVSQQTSAPTPAGSAKPLVSITMEPENVSMPGEYSNSNDRKMNSTRLK